jgi:undecaprenyl-diphosphatase
MNELIIIGAKYLFIVSVLVWTGFWFMLPASRKRNFVILTLGAGVLAFIGAQVAGHFIYIERPFVVGHFEPLIAHAAGNGFPSDHTLLASLLGFAVYSYSKKTGIALLIIALMVGVSRVAAGVHHPLDVAASFAISGLAVVVTRILLNSYLNRRTRQ